MSVIANSNTARLWSFKKPTRVSASYVKSHVMGFYSLNGKSILSFPEKSKTEDFILFMKKIRLNNPNNKIILILDNYSTHHAKKVREVAKELNIILTYLPPYSPDLNPIEFIWKSVKRHVSYLKVIKKEDIEKNVIEFYMKVSKSLSFAKSWISKFLTT